MEDAAGTADNGDTREQPASATEESTSTTPVRPVEATPSSDSKSLSRRPQPPLQLPAPLSPSLCGSSEPNGVDGQPVTVHLSAHLRQRLSCGVARVTGVLQAEEEGVPTVEGNTNSPSSSTTSPQWRRNNPYATTPSASSASHPAPSAPFEDSGTGGASSPLPMNVTLHTGGSARVSRTTSMVKPGDARVTRTTSTLLGTSDARVTRTASMAMGSDAQVSRTTSMVTGKEPIFFPLQHANIVSSPASSARASRTTSMVRSYDYSMQGHPSQAPPPPPQLRVGTAAAASPTMNGSSPYLSSNFLNSASQAQHHAVSKINSNNTFGAHGSAVQLRATDSAVRGQEAEAVDVSSSSSMAFLQSHPFQFNASPHHMMMPLMDPAEENYFEDSMEVVGNDDEVLACSQERRGEIPSPTGTYHYDPASIDDDEAHAKTPGHHRSQQQQQNYSSRDYPTREESTTVPIFTPLAVYPGPMQSRRASNVNSTPHAHRNESPASLHSGSQANSDVRGTSSSCSHPSRLEEQQQHNRAQVFNPADSYEELPTSFQQPEAPFCSGGSDGDDGNDGTAFADQQDAGPNLLLCTQPPQRPSDGGSNATAAATVPGGGAAGDPVNPMGITEAELTSLLQAAQNRAQERSDSKVEELWCPPGSEFSVYDAGMREHYRIPSEEVAVTCGAIKYVSLYERYGNQTRFRFQLCNRYLHNRCVCGAECQYIHSHVVSKATRVHMNENNITTSGVRRMNPDELAGGRNTLRYRTMGPGMIFAIYPPNQLKSEPQLIPSELILATEGALQTYRVLASDSGRGALSSASSAQQPMRAAGGGPSHLGGSDVVLVRPRHCAHFQFKRMCNLGSACHFIHSLIPFVQGMLNQPPLPTSVQVGCLEDGGPGFVLPEYRSNASEDMRRSSAVGGAAGGNVQQPLSSSASMACAPMSVSRMPPAWATAGANPYGGADPVPVMQHPADTINIPLSNYSSQEGSRVSPQQAAWNASYAPQAPTGTAAAPYTFLKSPPMNGGPVFASAGAVYQPAFLSPPHISIGADGTYALAPQPQQHPQQPQPPQQQHQQQPQQHWQAMNGAYLGVSNFVPHNNTR